MLIGLLSLRLVEDVSMSRFEMLRAVRTVDMLTCRESGGV
jgi:hypothetical protein